VNDRWGKGLSLGRRRNVGVALAAIAMMCLTCFSAFAAGDKQVVKIGVLAPITGPASADGEEFVRGVQLAVNEINKAGGVLGYTFEVAPGDTMDMKPDSVLSAVNKLLSDPKVGIVLTGYCSNSNFEVKNMAEAGMPYIIAGYPAQTAEIISPNPDKFPTVWSYSCSFRGYETELPKVVEGWAKDGKLTLKGKKVALIASDNPYSMTIYKGLKETFAQMGWTITLDEKVPFAEVLDWRVILGKIRGNEPDLIVNTDYLPANGATFVQQFMENPTKSLVFIQYGPSVPEFLELTKEQSTGVLYNYITAPLPTARSKKIKEAYIAANGSEPGGYGYMLYEMVYLYADILKQVKDPKNHLAVGKAIGRIDTTLSMGRLKFDPKTHLAISGGDFIPTVFYQIWNGERILLYPKAYSTGEFRLPPWMR
jgi:branched-chain amino acid transport system substrate-binding protein